MKDLRNGNGEYKCTNIDLEHYEQVFMSIKILWSTAIYKDVIAEKQTCTLNKSKKEKKTRMYR